MTSGTRGVITVIPTNAFSTKQAKMARKKSRALSPPSVAVSVRKTQGGDPAVATKTFVCNEPTAGSSAAVFIIVVTSTAIKSARSTCRRDDLDYSSSTYHKISPCDVRGLGNDQQGPVVEMRCAKKQIEREIYLAYVGKKHFGTINSALSLSLSLLFEENKNGGNEATAAIVPPIA